MYTTTTFTIYSPDENTQEEYEVKVTVKFDYQEYPGDYEHPSSVTIKFLDWEADVYPSWLTEDLVRDEFDSYTIDKSDLDLDYEPSYDDYDD